MLTIDLTGKTALVIGGSRGIGGAVTQAVCQAGARTVFTHTGAAKHAGRVEELLSTAHQAGGIAHAVVADACNSAETDALIDRVVREFGKLDILVFNVGQNRARPVEDITDADWRQFIDLNLSSAFYAVRAALPHMIRARYGRIVLIGSSAVVDGGGGAVDYAAAKSGLEGMMRCLCRQYARKGILTNVIHPCLIDTDLLKERYGRPEQREQLTAQIPVGRLGQPDDIAGLVAYLASSWGDYLCGQSILVDGGRTLFK